VSDRKQSIQLEAALRSAGYAEAKAECASECAAAAAECEALKTRLSTSEAARMSVTEQSETRNARTAELEAELAGMRATGTLGSRKALKAEHEAQLEVLQQLRRTDAFQAEERGRAAARDELAEQLRGAADELMLAEERAAQERVQMELSHVERLGVLQRSASELAEEAVRLRMSTGKAKAKTDRLSEELETLRGEASTGGGGPSATRRAEKAPAAREEATSARKLKERIRNLEKEMAAARATVAEQRDELDALSGQQPLGRRSTKQGAASTMPAARLRVSGDQHGCAEAPFEARSLEFLRALVEETNMSLSGAATANALVMQLQTGQEPAPERLTCRESVTRSYKRLGALDRAAYAAANAKQAAWWAFSTDAGNKGRAIQMMAISVWCEATGMPMVQLLGACDLFGDQSAKNSAKVNLAAIRASGLHADRNIAGCSDGTQHAVDEMLLTVTSLNEEGRPGEGLRAIQEFCAIHGKALEENAGMEAAFPGGYLVDALRLLWEVLHSPEGGRLGEYMRIWTKECGFPSDLFDRTLGKLPEPTSSKWQVMFGVCEALLPLLEPVAHGANRFLDAAARPSYLEAFLDKCALLMCGSVDQTKQTRVTHTHSDKITKLRGVFHQLDVEAGIHLMVDMGESNYREFYKFAKSPAR